MVIIQAPHRIWRSMNRGKPIYFEEQNKVILPVFKCGYTSTHKAYSKIGKVLESFNDLIDYEGVEKLAMVRNPYARIVSLYTRGNNNIDGCHSEKRTFEEFVTYIEMLLDNGYADGHYNTLVQNLSIKGKLLPDKIFKLEDGTDEFTKALPALSGAFPKANMSPNKQEGHRGYYSTEKLRLRVAKLYEEDLDTFKYTF